MIGLRLWQLADLAVPLFVLLAALTILMFVFAYFVIYNVAVDMDGVEVHSNRIAVMVSGVCGFGMGAAPNAMSNMQAVTERFGPSIMAFLIVPIAGSIFADFINSLCITIFLNLN